MTAALRMISPTRPTVLGTLLAAMIGAHLAEAAAGQVERPSATPETREPTVHSSSDLVLEELVEVSLIQFDAVITDPGGEAIRDLDPKDFALRVDGKKVAVDGVSTGEELRETVAGRQSIVLLIDNRHLEKSQRDEALGDIEEVLLEEMRTQPTWVAVVSYGDKLNPLLAPTQDRGAVREAIARIRATEPPPNLLQSQQRASVEDVNNLLTLLSQRGSRYRMGLASLSGVEFRLREYGRALSNDTLETLRAIEELVEGLSYVPGRKAVLYVTDGIPRNPLDSVAETMFDHLAGGSRSRVADDTITQTSGSGINDTNSRPRGSEIADNSSVIEDINQQDDGGAFEFQRAINEFSRDRDFEAVTARANTYGVSFYPLRPPIADASKSGMSDARTKRGAISSLSDLSIGLQILAEDTGGLFYDGEAGVRDFLVRARLDLAAYYSLSFKPPKPNKRTSGIRSIHLKIRKRRADLRYQRSFVPQSLEQRLASRAWGTLLFGWQENQHGALFESTVAKTPGPDGELHAVELTVSLPIGELELLPAGDEVSGLLKLVLQTRRANGERLTPHHMAFAVTIPADEIEEARTQYFAVRTELQLPAGSYDLAVGLWEENTGSSSFITRRVEVGDSDPTFARRRFGSPQPSRLQVVAK